MFEINGDQQMKDVWTLPAIQKWEKNCGKHPTQKPLSVLTRVILASTKHNAWILDPFAGSSTTGIAANLLNRKFLGIDLEEDYLQLSQKRKIEIETSAIQKRFRENMNGFKDKNELTYYLQNECRQKVEGKQ